MCKCEMSPNFPHEHIEGEEGRDLIQCYIRKITEHSAGWDCSGIHVPWFRGQPNTKSPLPAVLRTKKNKEIGRYDEFWLSTTFRNRAPSFGETPENRADIDKWLFLMQHVELPTRLLDWTESALAALYFAVNDQTKDTNAAVWIINPVALNHVSLRINEELNEDLLESNNDCFPNTWVKNRQSLENIRLAFMHPDEQFSGHNPSEKPIAIQLTYCHARMSAQKGCFTVHGKDVKRGFEEIFNEGSKLFNKGYFKKYVINRKDTFKIYKGLQTLGITSSTIYPDLYGLAEELKERFWYPDKKQEESNKSKLEDKSNLVIRTEILADNSIENLKKEYQKFITNVTCNPNFYSLERTDFFVEDNVYKYCIGYWVKEG